MTGPEQMPLEPGRWRLEHHGQPVTITARTLDPDRAVGRFSLVRGEYVAAPSIDWRTVHSSSR